MKWVLHIAFTCLLLSHLHKTPRRSINQVRYKLGVPGKTKDGHDCYVHYDKDCTPVESGPEAKANSKAPAKPFCHPFDPNCGKIIAPAAAPIAAEAPKASSIKDGIILPHPDCDPEIDYNCRLRRAKRDTATADQPAADEPTKEAAAAPRFEDFLKGVMRQHK